MRFKNTNPIVLGIILFLLCFLSGAVNWIFQFIIVCLLYLVTGMFVAYRLANYTKKKWMYLLLALPFPVFYSIISLRNIYLDGFYATAPIWVGAILYFFLGYFIYHRAIRLKGLIVLVVLTALVNFLFIHNWFALAFEKEYQIQKFPEISLIKSDGTPYELEKNKLLVFDLWSTSCGNCIAKFPDYEKLSRKYAPNPEVEFYTLNLPTPRDSIYNPAKIVANYDFKTVFAPDKSAWKAFGISTVPQYVIVNKDANIVYRGRLHDKWYHFYNNIDHLIAKHLE